MGLGSTARVFFEEALSRYSMDGRKLSGIFRDALSVKDSRLFKYCYQPYKWLLVAPLLIGSTFIFGILAILSSVLFSPRAGRIFAVAWARLNSFFTPMTVSVSGLENIDPEKSYVVVANHQSLYDIYVLYGWLGRDFKWVMKKELAMVPVLGLACRALGHIFIDRSDSAGAVNTLNDAKKKITNGTSVLFFPEGSRSGDGRVGTFKKGAFRIALDLGIPVLPVTLNGTREVLPKGSTNLMPGAVSMIIHKPLSVKNYNEKNMKKLMTKARIAIISALG